MQPAEAILRALSDRPLDTAQLVGILAGTPVEIEAHLVRLVRAGRIVPRHLQTLPPRTVYHLNR